MEREQIRQLFGVNYIGKEELKPFFKALGIGVLDIQELPIEYSDSQLQEAADQGYILIYGIGEICGHSITLKYLRDTFGIDPDQSEPCLYNQDWYMKEDFMDTTLERSGISSRRMYMRNPVP